MIEEYKNCKTSYTAIDLFSGCGGLTEGLHQAGFHTRVAVEVDEIAVTSFKMNHYHTNVIQKDIRDVKGKDIRDFFGNKELHLLAGCPPCQGFSSIRKLNRKRSVKDPRNSLVIEYFRLVNELRPLTIMMENVPGLKDYYLFKDIVKQLCQIGYQVDIKVVDVKNYGVPQSRKRLVMVGSLIGEIKVAEGTNEKITVRGAIGDLELAEKTKDPLHKIVAQHSARILNQIKATPKNGGSRTDLPKEFELECHKKEGVGFNDVYGRLRWDDYSSTITGGCLNPSKGRFLHPEEDRVITPREAALLQSFPPNYKFAYNIPKGKLALLIGNALPPKFSYIQSLNIRQHLDQHLP